jgi:hypothetical protein
MGAKTKAVPQLQADDMASLDTQRRAMNDILTSLASRLDALESSPANISWQQLPDITFDTGNPVTAGSKPFDSSLRCACPFTPTGLIILRLEQLRPAGQPVITNANGVAWRFLGGSGKNSTGNIVVDYIAGLSINATYRLRLGASRG